MSTKPTRCYMTDSPHTDEKGNRFDGHARVLKDGEVLHVPMMARDSATAAPVRFVDWMVVQRAAGQVIHLI